MVDGRLDAETFGRFIKNVGGNRSAMKTEAEALATRDAAALLNVFKQSQLHYLLSSALLLNIFADLCVWMTSSR